MDSMAVLFTEVLTVVLSCLMETKLDAVINIKDLTPAYRGLPQLVDFLTKNWFP